MQEALYQCASDGTPFVDCLQQQGVLPGVKVDEAWACTYISSLTSQSQALYYCSHATFSAAACAHPPGPSSRRSAAWLPMLPQAEQQSLDIPRAA